MFKHLRRLGLATLLVAVLVLGILLGSVLATSPLRVQGQNTIDDETVLLQNVYKLVNPSVVNIRVTIRPGADSTGLLPIEPLPTPPGTPSAPGSNPPLELGDASGFVYDTKGHIVTNAHVVADADKITVTFADANSYKATVVGVDLDSDVAVLQIDASKENATPLVMADSDKLLVGERAIAIGNPFRLNGTMTQGIVSAVGRSLDSQRDATQASRYLIPDVIQTDAPINPGNSGGPLLNGKGEVIGVNTAYLRQSLGLGFAIPSNIVNKVAAALIAKGKVDHSYLGIAGGTLTPELNDLIGLDENFHGVLVSDVTPSGPAGQAGVKGSTAQKQLDGQPVAVGGDIIVAIDDIPVKRFEDLLSYLFAHTEPGQTVKLKILRNGKTVEVSVKLGIRPTGR
jgi:serine protease Do